MKEWINRLRGTDDREMRMSFRKQHAEGDMKGVGRGASRPFTLITGCGRCRLTKIGRKRVVERKLEGTLFFFFI